MNALVSALPREDKIQSKIRKVRRFGRGARFVCGAFVAFGLTMCAVLLYLTVFDPIRGLKIDNGGVAAWMSPITMQLRWLASFGFWITAGYQLYRLFGNLAAGAIYTSENVRRVRNVGLLWLLFAVLGIVLPATFDVARQLIDGLAPIDFKSAVKFANASIWQLWESFSSAGIVLLASWIMDVGLYEKEHADALRRDADLVI